MTTTIASILLIVAFVIIIKLFDMLTHLLVNHKLRQAEEKFNSLFGKEVSNNYFEEIDNPEYTNAMNTFAKERNKKIN